MAMKHGWRAVKAMGSRHLVSKAENNVIRHL